MKARVTVTLKNGVLDPQGKAIEGALRSLGVEGVDSVRQGKMFEVELATSDPERAKTLFSEVPSHARSSSAVSRIESRERRHARAAAGGRREADACVAFRS